MPYRFVPHTTKTRWLLPGAAGLEPGERVNERALLAVAHQEHVLPGLLKRRGYHTAAVVEDGLGEMLAPGLYGAGFDEYRELDDLPKPLRTPKGLVDLALETVRQAADASPVFLWMHHYGLRLDDYYPRRATPKERYLVEVQEIDRELGRFIASVKRERPDAVVFIVSTHGLRIKSHRYHGNDLAEASLRVPLIVTGTGIAVGRDPRLASTVDLLPTILGFAGGDVRAAKDGVDLFAPDAVTERVLISDTWATAEGQFLFDYVAAFDGRYKVIINRGSLNAVPLEQAPTPGAAVSPADVRAWKAVETAGWKYLEETGYSPGAAFSDLPPP